MPSSGGLVALPEILHITRREAIRPPVGTLIEFLLTLSSLTHGPLRRKLAQALGVDPAELLKD